LAPLIVVAVIAEGRFSVAEAGWVLSARALGELLASLAVPALGLLHLGRSAAFAASACLLSALVVSMSAHLAAVVLGFFVVGACSGVLKFLGTMAASAYRHRTFAFILRLALTLALAGIATCILLAMEASSSWATLLERLIVLLLPIMVLGGCFYRPLKEQHSSSRGRCRWRTTIQLADTVHAPSRFLPFADRMSGVGPLCSTVVNRAVHARPSPPVWPLTRSSRSAPSLRARPLHELLEQALPLGGIPEWLLGHRFHGLPRLSGLHKGSKW
jgi:hypothetical protein